MDDLVTEPPTPPSPHDPGTGANPGPASDGPLDETIRAAFDSALARWNEAFGITPEDEASLELSPDNPDTTNILARSSIRAINKYIDEHGLSPGGEDLLKPTPSFLAAHATPLINAVLAAVEESISHTLSAQMRGLRTEDPGPSERLKIDLSDLLDPEGK